MAMRILLIEDDTKLSEMLTDGLTRWGYACRSVEDFSAVMEAFTEYDPHLVVMDINLPAYDGFYWCGRIRQVSKVPVLFLSARDTNMDIVMAVNAGGDDYVTKPFSMEVLLAKVSALLRRAYDYAETAPPVLVYGEWVLDTGRQALVGRDREVTLTRNEFRILYALLTRRSQVVSREDLMRDLWEDARFVDDNTLTVNMGRLRKKLEEAGLSGMIETKVGQGYIIAERPKS
jgi:DNA-binding response OmpR family regulator